MNKIFRLNGGIAFYNSSEKGEFIYNESIGLSINFRFIGDLFEIFNGATTNQGFLRPNIIMNFQYFRICFCGFLRNNLAYDQLHFSVSNSI